MNRPPGHLPPDEDETDPELKSIDGDVYFLSRRPDFEIPEERSRICPQCGHETWIGTRWCRICVFDIDGAELDKFHPVKLLWFFGAVMLVQSLVILYLAMVR